MPLEIFPGRISPMGEILYAHAGTFAPENFFPWRRQLLKINGEIAPVWPN
jgi:hypothetical protein